MLNRFELCTTANDPAEMSQWVISVVLGALADVGFTPNREGNDLRENAFKNRRGTKRLHSIQA